MSGVLRRLARSPEARAAPAARLLGRARFVAGFLRFRLLRRLLLRRLASCRCFLVVGIAPDFFVAGFVC